MRPGRVIDVRAAATGSNWLVLITESFVVTPAAIASMRVELEAVANRYAGEYDGWEAAVTPD